MDEDYYQVLGIQRNASQAEIQRAYRELARKYHPDMNPEDKTAKERFQRVQQAYDVLGNAEKREMYDRYGSSFQSARPGGGPWQTHRGGAAGSGFEEFDFSQLFGGRGAEAFADVFQQFGGPRTQHRRAPPRSHRGADIETNLDVPFQTAVTGGTAALTIQRPSGKIETIHVKIPAGIESGKKIRLRGQGGESPANGAAGDLLVRVTVRPHPYFRRKNRDLELDVPVTLAEAALGARVDIPTPRGTITLKIPPETSSGRRLRVKGHGIATDKGPAGDLYAVVSITLPRKLDPETADLIRRFDELNPLAPRTDLTW